LPPIFRYVWGMPHPTPFNEFAFLSDELEGWVADFKKNHHECLTLAHEANSLALETFSRCHNNGDDARLFLCSILLVRIITNFQSFLLLEMRGLEAEARAILRSLLEALFVLQANEKSPGFSGRYARHSMNEHRKYLKKLDELKALGVEYLPDLQALTPFTKDDALAIWQIAKEAGMEEIYVMQYSRLCMHTHPSAIGLMDGLSETQGDRKKIEIIPRDIDADHNILTGVSFIVMALASVDRIYSFGILDRILTLMRREDVLSRSRMQ
jgi:Family of unknown function (DUF5677)